MRVHAAQHVADVRAPVLFANAERVGRGAAATEDAHGAVGRAETVLDVERLPRTALLVLRERDAVIGVVVALRAHVREPGQRAALQILREQTVGAADRRVGVVVGRQGTGPRVHLDLVADRPVDHGHGGHRAGRAAARAHAGGRERQDHREILRPGARHHRVHRDLLHRVFPRLAEVRGTHAPDDLVRLAARRREHRRDPFFRGKHDRQIVRPPVLHEQVVQVLLGVGLDEARRGSVVLDRPDALAVERCREPLDDLLHDRPPGERVSTVDVGAELGRRLAHHRLRDEHLPEL